MRASGTTVKKLTAVRDNLARKGGLPVKKGSKRNASTSCVKHLDKILNSLS